MAVGDRTSFLVMMALSVGTIGTVLLTSAMRKADKEQQRPFGEANLERFRGR